MQKRRQYSPIFFPCQSSVIGMNKVLFEQTGYSGKDIVNFLESICLGFVTLDQDWRFTYINRQAALDLGYEPENLLGRVVWDCMEFVNKAEIGEHLRRAMQKRKSSNFEYYCSDRGQHFSCSVHPSASGIIVYWEDATKYKHAQKEVFRYRRKADLLYEVAEKLHTSNRPQSIIKKLCLKVNDFLDCQVFINYLVDEEKNKLKMNACWGLDDQAKKKLEWLDYGASLCGRTARDKTRVIAENIQNSNDIDTECIRMDGIRAYACHPLVEKGKVVGTLAFASRKKDTFSQDDLALMKAVSDLMAIAINRVRTERAMNQQHQQILKSERERIDALKDPLK